MGDKTTGKVNTHIFPYFGYNSHELVFGNEARPWHPEWDILREGFLLTFSFEDSFASINEALQEIKAVIFITLKEPMEWTQPDWSTHLCHVLECYNVTIEEEDEYLRNINIPEAEGHREVKGPQIQNPNISAPLKTMKVNIGTEAKLKFAKIRDYWDDATLDKVIELLH